MMFTANDIRALRLAMGNTQAEFGEKLGVPVSTVSNWETGRSHPRFAAMAKLNELANQEHEIPAVPTTPIRRGPRMPKAATA